MYDDKLDLENFLGLYIEIVGYSQALKLLEEYAK
jgi:hypothetical protein